MTLVTVYRPPHRRYFVEFPGGRVDPGESSLTAAKRELLEETGYRGGVWEPLGSIVPATALTDEVCDVWVARSAEPATGAFGAEVSSMEHSPPIGVAERLLETGADAVALAAWFLYTSTSR